MNIGMTPVIDYKHLGEGYESYKVIETNNHATIRILEKSLTDNSTLYDVQIYEDGGDCFVVVPANNLWHARRILKAIDE